MDFESEKYIGNNPSDEIELLNIASEVLKDMWKEKISHEAKEELFQSLMFTIITWAEKNVVIPEKLKTSMLLEKEKNSSR